MDPNTPPIPWLLAADTPSIRYFTRLRLLGLPQDDPQVRADWAAMQAEGPIPAILARQGANGAWLGEHSYYTPKYTSTHWAMMLLEELGADPTSEGYRRGAEYMLSTTQKWLGELRGKAHPEIECLWGNILRYVARAGLLDDPRAQAMLDYLVTCAVKDRWRCPINWDAPCSWGAARAMWGFAAIPAPERSRFAGLEEAIASGLALLIEDYSLVEVNYPVGEGKPHPLWGKLSFPLFYQADILFVLRLLAEHGALDRPNAVPALRWLAERQGKNGRLRGSNPFRQRTYDLGSSEETNRWVTLHAQIILTAAAEA